MEKKMYRWREAGKDDESFKWELEDREMNEKRSKE